MTDKGKYMELYECMDKISIRLGALHNMVFTLHVGMWSERMDKQTLDCVESINFCISDIKNMVDKCLEQYAENKNIITEKEEA